MKPKYKRTVIFENKDVEVILIDWKPGAKTPIHDHGKSRGIIRILEGSLTEEIFLAPSLKQIFKETYKKDMELVEFPVMIHRMKNTCKTIARSLHIYTPPLVMREYKERRRKK